MKQSKHSSLQAVWTPRALEDRAQQEEAAAEAADAPEARQAHLALARTMRESAALMREEEKEDSVANA